MQLFQVMFNTGWIAQLMHQGSNHYSLLVALPHFVQRVVHFTSKDKPPSSEWHRQMPQLLLGLRFADVRTHGDPSLKGMNRSDDTDRKKFDQLLDFFTGCWSNLDCLVVHDRAPTQSSVDEVTCLLFSPSLPTSRPSSQSITSDIYNTAISIQTPKV